MKTLELHYPMIQFLIKRLIIQQIVTLSKYGHDASPYLSSVGNRYPAIYVASYVGRKSEVKKCRQKDFKMLRALLSIC